MLYYFTEIVGFIIPIFMGIPQSEEAILAGFMVLLAVQVLQYMVSVNGLSGNPESECISR